VSNRDPFDGSPAGPGADPAGVPPDDPLTTTGPGADPAGGPPYGGQRPAGSNSEPLADASREPAGDGTSASAAAQSDASVEGGATEPDAPTNEDDAVARERDEYREALVRLQADFENYKKRMLKQQTEHLERAASSLVDKLLPVLDTADLALAHGGGEDVKQITASLMNALEKEGLERIAGEGAPFDPMLHDAVAHEPGDGDGEQVVVEVLRAGYRWKGLVLRPAMVKVRG
jgi:molecular chaperone GrpE